MSYGFGGMHGGHMGGYFGNGHYGGHGNKYGYVPSGHWGGNHHQPYPLSAKERETWEAHQNYQKVPENLWTPK